MGIVKLIYFFDKALNCLQNKIYSFLLKYFITKKFFYAFAKLMHTTV